VVIYDSVRRYLLALICAVFGFGQAGETEATRRLRALEESFQPAIVRVSESVYTAVGYGRSAFSMIVGSDGVVMIEAGPKPGIVGPGAGGVS